MLEKKKEINSLWICECIKNKIVNGNKNLPGLFEARQIFPR